MIKKYCQFNESLESEIKNFLYDDLIDNGIEYSFSENGDNFLICISKKDCDKQSAISVVKNLNSSHEFNVRLSYDSDFYFIFNKEQLDGLIELFKSCWRTISPRKNIGVINLTKDGVDVIKLRCNGKTVTDYAVNFTKIKNVIVSGNIHFTYDILEGAINRWVYFHLPSYKVANGIMRRSWDSFVFTLPYSRPY